MEQNELGLKLRELLQDEEYAKSLFELETSEEVQASLAAKGIEMPLEDIEKLRELLVKTESGELSEEDLESVVGGALADDVENVCNKIYDVCRGIVNSIKKKRW